MGNFSISSALSFPLLGVALCRTPHCPMQAPERLAPFLHRIKQAAAHLLTMHELRRRHLLQDCLQLPDSHEPLELAANNPFAIDDENPRLSVQTPLFDRRKCLFSGEILPDLLVYKGDSFAVTRQQGSYDIHYRTAHPSEAELRCRENNELGLALSDGIRDPYLMQPRIRRLARVDLAQIVDIAGN